MKEGMREYLTPKYGDQAPPMLLFMANCVIHCQDRPQKRLSRHGLVNVFVPKPPQCGQTCLLMGNAVE